MSVTVSLKVKVTSRLQQQDLVTLCTEAEKEVRAGGAPKWEQDAYLVGTRAAQAGGLTAAGYALAQLTTQFGGPADKPEPNQLSM